MADVLDKICADKRQHVAASRARRSEADLLNAAANADPVRGFLSALEQKTVSGDFGLIAEIKKASPSKGLIRADFDPPSLAVAYAQGGASCLSVLTDIPYFQGQDAYLGAARQAVNLPVLRKDFMLEPYQIAESRVLGADCILLIMAALSDAQAMELEAAAISLGMDVLVEIHNADELDRALQLQSRLLGINNRNLKTLEVNLATTEELAAGAPKDRVLVSESGIYSHDDLLRMAEVGCRCFLVGESLMRQPDVAEATTSLLSPSPANAARI